MELPDAEQEAVMNMDVMLLALLVQRCLERLNRELQSADLMPQFLMKDV